MSGASLCITKPRFNRKAIVWLNVAVRRAKTKGGHLLSGVNPRPQAKSELFKFFFRKTDQGGSKKYVGHTGHKNR